jgi:phosphohistidine swiveling domain-containing protein
MKDTNFLSIGKLEKNENFEELINSWTKFNEKLVICGNGSLKNQLQELISNTNQSKKILIINPKSFTLEELFSKSKCLILISNAYDTSILAINALKNNVPVIATENKNINFLLPRELIHNSNQPLSFTQFLGNYVPAINQYKFDSIFSYVQNRYKDKELNNNDDFYDLVFNKDK